MLSKARISAVMMVGASARFGKWKKYSAKKDDCDSVYIARFGTDEPLSKDYTGEFKMTIKENGETEYDIDFKVPDSDSAITAFKYHLHSDYDETALDGDLTGTSGHYDPDFKCGPASSMNEATNLIGPSGKPTQCNDDVEQNYVCNTANQGGCERGDLSGKRDSLPVINGEVQVNNLIDNVNPPRNCDFYELGTKTGAGFNSVIFHNADGGARIFGGKLELQKKSRKSIAKTCQKYYGKLDGEGINNGVKGKFTMELCDGAPAKYKFFFFNLWNADMEAAFLNANDGNTTALDISKKKGFAWHLHSAASVTVLGGAGTGGHYDPFFKCGPASSWQNTANFDNTVLCEGNYPNNGYELGDLNGKLELTKVPDAHGNLFQFVRNDISPPRNCDYDEVGQVDSGAVFSSVVFHDGSGKKTRLFGVNLKRSFPWWR